MAAEVIIVRALTGREREAEAGATADAAEVHLILREEEAPAITASPSQWTGRMVDQDHARVHLTTEVMGSTRMKAPQQ